MPEIRRLTSSQLSTETKNYDLPRLACNAAFELDNLLIGEFSDLGEIECLAKLLIRNEKGSLLLDPTTVMVMSMAIDDTEPSLNLTRVSGVVHETEKMGRVLHKVATNPKGVPSTDIEKLRNYCLALSEHASGNEPSFDEGEAKHPWRH